MISGRRKARHYNRLPAERNCRIVRNLGTGFSHPSMRFQKPPHHAQEWEPVFNQMMRSIPEA
jgi:hypothetical protein